MKRKCVVCRERSQRGPMVIAFREFCDECFDDFSESDAKLLLTEWVANRARRFERARQRGK